MEPRRPLRLTIGVATVTIYDGYTVTRFMDGTEVTARHDDMRGLGQMATAADLGYSTVEALNAEHDIYHSLLARWLGLTRSPQLYALAHGMSNPLGALEE